jgi:hypothetical protein
MVLACNRVLYFPLVASPESPAKCSGYAETARSPKKDGHLSCASTHQDTKYHTVHPWGVLKFDDAAWLDMSRPSAAAALRESFGDRRPPDISRKITACVSCRKLKVQ